MTIWRCCPSSCFRSCSCSPHTQWWIIVPKVTFIIPSAFLISLAAAAAATAGAYLCRKLNSRYPGPGTSPCIAVYCHVTLCASGLQIDCMDLILRIRHQRTSESNPRHSIGVMHHSGGGLCGRVWQINEIAPSPIFHISEFPTKCMCFSLNSYFMSINCILRNFPFPFYLKTRQGIEARRGTS